MGGPKLLQKLGPRWSSQELATFYDGVMQHLLDFDQILSQLTGRTIEMLKTLYLMNQNYLNSAGSTREGFLGVMNDIYSLFAGPTTPGPDKHDQTPSKTLKRSSKKRRVVEEPVPEAPPVIQNNLIGVRKRKPDLFFGNSPLRYPGNGGLDWNGVRCLQSLTTQQRLFYMYEWFYNDVSRVFFMTNEFVSSIERLGMRVVFCSCSLSRGLLLSQSAPMSRRSWSSYRVLLGRPRRLSAHYFKQERENFFAFKRQFSSSPQKQLLPGSHVTAVHPIHKYQSSGVVLNYDMASDLVRIQFDRTDEGIYYCSPIMVAAQQTVAVVPSSPHFSVIKQAGGYRRYEYYVYSVVVVLLERKRLLIRELHRYNRAVNSFDGSFEKHIQLKVAWLLTNIRYTEECLRQVVSEGNIDMKGDKELCELDEFCDSCDRASCLLIATRATTLDSFPNDYDSELLWLAKEVELSHDPIVKNHFRVLTTSISLLMAIRNCSDKYIEKEKMIVYMDSILNRLRPRFHANDRLYKILLSQMEAIKACCVSRIL